MYKRQSKVLLNVVAPVTPKVPATAVLPVDASTVKLFVFISKSPSIPVAPDTSNVLLIVVPNKAVSPDTVKSLLSDISPVTNKSPPTEV